MDSIINLIEYGYECEYLDYKEKQYSKEKHSDLITDIMAMANSRHEGDKFIIIGVKDKPDGKQIKGIPSEEFIDSATYTQVIHSNIEPEIQFDYFKYEYNGYTLGIFRIYNTNNKPYMIKKNFNKLNMGLCLVRKGSTNSAAKRSDFDFMYKYNGNFEMKFLEETLYGIHVNSGCASIKILLANTTECPITIISGYINILNKDGENITRLPVYGLDKIVGADFQISIFPKTEIVGDLFVGFSSSDPLRLGMGEYGIANQEYRFDLVLFDARDKEYSMTLEQGNILVKEDFLWKVRNKKGLLHEIKNH